MRFVRWRTCLDCRIRVLDDADRAPALPRSGTLMTQQAFTTSLAVRKYIEELAGKGLTDSEQQQRLAMLAEFCNFVDRTPDQMVGEIFDVETQKYKKRNFYSDRVKEFSAQISGTW